MCTSTCLATSQLSHSMIVHVIYIGIIKVGVSCPKIPPTNQPNINFVTAWQHWLDIAKPKNVFRLTSCYEISCLTGLTTWLSDYLMPSDKRNSITTRAMGSISSLFNVTSSLDVPFCQLLQLQYFHYGSIKAYLCSWFLCPLPHRWKFVVASLHGFVEDLVIALIAEVFNLLSFSLKRSLKC